MNSTGWRPAPIPERLGRNRALVFDQLLDGLLISKDSDLQRSDDSLAFGRPYYCGIAPEGIRRSSDNAMEA